jgi:hypothetical protein
MQRVETLTLVLCAILALQSPNAAMGDIIFEGQTMCGLPGEAYGLVSDWYFDPVLRNGIIFLTNGVWNGYSFGDERHFTPWRKGFLQQHLKRLPIALRLYRSLQS